MGVYIKGITMPKDGCKDCLLVKRGQVFDICPFLKREVNGNVERGGKPYDCPLIELPDHGDLVDKGVLMARYTGLIDVYIGFIEDEDEPIGLVKDKEVVEFIDTAPVVIPAERNE